MLLVLCRCLDGYLLHSLLLFSLLRFSREWVLNFGRLLPPVPPRPLLASTEMTMVCLLYSCPWGGGFS